jgi:hypothetical protein
MLGNKRARAADVVLQLLSERDLTLGNINGEDRKETLPSKYISMLFRCLISSTQEVKYGTVSFLKSIIICLVLSPFLY